VAPRTEGTAVLTCENHPTYRWVHTKYSLPGATRTFMGSGVLMFEGEEGGKPACPFNLSERSLGESPPEYQEHFRERYTPECDCPASALTFLRWSEED
jgi:hypothetical protein